MKVDAEKSALYKIKHLFARQQIIANYTEMHLLCLYSCCRDILVALGGADAKNGINFSITWNLAKRPLRALYGNCKGLRNPYCPRENGHQQTM